MLRAAVEKVDRIKPKRAFRDRTEWKTILEELQKAGKLTFDEQSDTITLLREATAGEAE